MSATSRRPVSVFISYRREGGFYLARNIYDDLKSSGYDVFMDVHSLGAGEFESVTLAEIRVRDYFVIVLTRGSLDRIGNADDWLRREVLAAREADRTIVPVLDSNFSFDDAVRRILAEAPKAISDITLFNAVRMPLPEYFDKGLERLRGFLLEKPHAARVPATPSREVRRAEQQLAKHVVPAPADLTGADRKARSFQELDNVFQFRPQDFTFTSAFRLRAPKLTPGLFENTVMWTDVPGADEYVVERDVTELFLFPEEVYRGPSHLYWDVRGPFGVGGFRTFAFYRVKAIDTSGVTQSSNWSDAVKLVMKPRGRGVAPWPTLGPADS